jgi:hypothetical protein
MPAPATHTPAAIGVKGFGAAKVATVATPPDAVKKAAAVPNKVLPFCAVCGLSVELDLIEVSKLVEIEVRYLKNHAILAIFRRRFEIEQQS